MEADRIARELEEKLRLERAAKVKEQFADPNGQWEKDKADIQKEAIKEKENLEKKASAQKAATDDTKAQAPAAAQKAATDDTKAQVLGPAEPQDAQKGGSKDKTQVLQTPFPLTTFNTDMH